ncbi:HipA N-terminal domain-containing protein [Fulvivirga lutea]|uniref:HipA N-terminal domain-containing protein n=1 Tax=Fulvivirga lutea TaxID=2810512 RepID=A0A974WKW6_9BACT|nr:HipA N-terminal domain-containing protein [Fulvivirga lutea]QSE97248.1 HipA N-terminal domain-containing protein [Fulvivirga lutea]
MKKAKVYMHTQLAGVLTEDENGYHFNYDPTYLEQNDSESISLTLPLSSEGYHSQFLFPFFDGLIPEGWLLDIAQKNWKLNPRDRMSILLKTCHDCIGAVSIQPEDNEN